MTLSVILSTTIMSSSNEPSASADFDCEFNAPQFFDFEKMNAGGVDDDETFDEDIGEAEKYFGEGGMQVRDSTGSV